MASTSEIPLELFFEQSSSFCNSVKNDLDQFISKIENAFSTINCDIKVAPKQQRKSRFSVVPNLCTLDLKEFTRSKQNALQNLQTTFEAMELKWSRDIADMKDWFLRKVEDCLSKIQLEIKVSAKDLNLSETAHEIELHEEISSSDSEVNVSADHQSTDRFYATNPPAANISYNVYQQNKRLYRDSGISAVNSNTSDFQQNHNEFCITSAAAVSKSGKKRGTSFLTRKGTKVTRVNKEIHEEKDSGSDVEMNIPDQQNTLKFCSMSQPATRTRQSIYQNKFLSHAVSSATEDGNAGDFHQNIDVSMVVGKRGRNTTTRAQIRRSTNATVLSKEKIDEENSTSDSEIDVLADQQNISKSGNKRGTTFLTRKGTKVTRLNKEFHEEKNSGSDVEMDIPDQQNTHKFCSMSQPATRTRQSIYQSKSLSHTASSATEDGNASDFHQNIDVSMVVGKRGRNTTARAQIRKSTNATVLSKEKIDEENSISDSEIDVMADQQNICNIRSSSPPAPDSNSNVFQQNTSLLHVTSAPAANMHDDKKGLTSKSKSRKGTKATQLKTKEILKQTSVLSTNVSEIALKSKMTDWLSLIGAASTAPCKPGLYEVKVWRAKKPAYIGHSNDIQKTVSLYREGQPSGEKHLDLFIQRNKDEVSIRYAVHPSVQLAKLEQKKKLKEFLEKHKNLPSYNYGM